MSRMKSTSESLRRRGMYGFEDIASLKERSRGELEAALKSGSAPERSAAVRLLAADAAGDSSLALRLAGMLKTEKALYTRLEICRTLEKCGAETARLLIPLAGTTGRGRYGEHREKVSLKKTYPLPGDIIARILGKMNPDALPVITEAICEGSGPALPELLDAAGFMVFHNKELATPENAEKIYAVLEKCRENLNVFRRAVRCLSAFPSAKTLEILTCIKNQHPEAGIRAEAARSETFVAARIKSRGKQAL